MIENKKCKYCNAPLPAYRLDSLGRKQPTSDFCNNKRRCEQAYRRKYNKEEYNKYMKLYMRDYKQRNKET